MDYEPILQFFSFEHLPPPLREVFKRFADLASEIVGSLPRNPERTVALRKLLEAKDAAVRSVIYQQVEEDPCLRCGECHIFERCADELKDVRSD